MDTYEKRKAYIDQCEMMLARDKAQYDKKMADHACQAKAIQQEIDDAMDELSRPWMSLANAILRSMPRTG